MKTAADKQMDRMSAALQRPAQLLLILLCFCGVQPRPILAQPEVPLASHQGIIVDVFTRDPAIISVLRRELDVWGLDRSKHSVVVYLPQGNTALLDDLGLRWQITQQRMQRLQTPRAFSGDVGSIAGFPCYRTVEQTFADLVALADANPELAAWIDIGDSWEKQQGQPGGAGGFDINALVLGRQDIVPLADFVIIAAMHAREYATAELATRFAEQLVSGYDVDADSTWLLDHYRVHIIPQLNPDGRKVAEVFSTRVKRKNHNENFCNAEFPIDNGIDLNRNSSVLWNFGAGSSGNECAQTFRGPQPSSEPETQAIEAYIDQVFPDARPGNPDDLNIAAPTDTPGLFISIHSFSELVLFPWEASAQNSGNHEGLRTLARKLAFFNGYEPCQDCLGTAAGTTPDYAYGERGVAAYTFEIGTSFFQSCDTFENSILPDNLQALNYALKAARRPYLEAAGPEITGLAIEPTENGVLVSAIADDGRRSNLSADGEPADPQQAIVSAQLSVNSPPFASAALLPMSASDGSFDSSSEAIQTLLPYAVLQRARNTIYLIATDSTGQSGVPSAIFISDTLFTDDFE